MEAEIVFNIIPEFTARANGVADGVRRAALQKIAERARELVPVETGATRDSIVVNEDESGVEAGEAAIFLEHGTIYETPRPFLGPATSQVQEEFAREFAASFAELTTLRVAFRLARPQDAQ